MSRRLWSVDDDAELRRLLAAGRRLGEIASRLNRPYSSICSRIGTLGMSGAHPRQAGRIDGVAPAPTLTRRMRRCLGCNRDFDSAGAHNRLCNRCRIDAAQASPYCP